MAVVCFPRLYRAGENGAIVAIADAVEQMHFDLVRAVLHAKARRGSEELEQVVSQFNWINAQTHCRSSSSDRLGMPLVGSLSRGKLINRSLRTPSQTAAEDVCRLRA